MASTPAHTKQPPRRLNVFQRAMLLWNRLHPYNALHAVQVEAPLDVERLRAAIGECCRWAGLTGLTLQDRGRVLAPADRQVDPPLVVLESAGDPAAARDAADRQIQREINTPFDLLGAFCPLRFFAAPSDEGFELGLTYCHFVADAVPISRLLELIVRTYLGQAQPREAQALTAPAPPRAAAIARAVLLHGWAWALTWPAKLVHLLWSAKPHYRDRGDHSNGFLSVLLDEPALAAVRGRASQWGVSLNDVFMAAMAKALEPLAGERISKSGRRSQVALQSISSLRGDIGATGQHRPGQAEGLSLLLGSFTVFHQPHLGVSVADVARRLARQTAPAKRHRLGLRSLVELRLTLPVLALGSPDRQQKLYRQHYALWGGITNVNMDAPPQRLDLAQVGGYRRAVSTGPVCPIVWSITTALGRLDVGISFRRTVLDDQAARQCLQRFVKALLESY